MSAVGVLTNVGSRHETTTGTVHLLETMAFGSTKHLDGLQISEWLQDWGATRFVSHSREQTLHCIDILRPNVDKAMGLLSEVVLEPRIADGALEDFYHALDTMAFQAQEQLPQLVLGEAIQLAAYGPDQQLGKLHFATPETIPLLSPPSVEAFHESAIKNNPHQMVVAGAGIAHDTLVDLASEFFGHVSQLSAPTTIPSVYRGGSHQAPKSIDSVSIFNPTLLPKEQLCHVALAFPVGGWHDSKEMVTACVVQMLLGGGSSFSAGGPGKGMYSRLYQTVLNKYAFLESAEAFTSFAEEAGLLGVTASTYTPQKIPQMVEVLTDSLLLLAIKPVGAIELSRARNMLKCNVLTQLESRLVVFEDMGRQVLTYGQREDAATTCAKIDTVTVEDIQEMVQKMLKHPLTFASSGYHLDKVPSHEQVQEWFTY
jgi:mitochondrial-processing peptidase subunit alpha